MSLVVSLSVFKSGVDSHRVCLLWINEETYLFCWWPGVAYLGNDGINFAEKSIFICADIFVSFALKQLITLIVLIYFVYI